MSVPTGGFSPAFFEYRPSLGATIKMKRRFPAILQGRRFS
jgi:hypothetical protein